MSKFELHPLIWVGDAEECQGGSESLAVVHAVMFPCRTLIADPSDTIVQGEYDLFVPLPSEPFALPSLVAFGACVDFALPHWNAERPLLIHCALGESRAPSLALVLISKHLHLITSASDGAAISAMQAIYPAYDPSPGITSFLHANWEEL